MAQIPACQRRQIVIGYQYHASTFPFLLVIVVLSTMTTGFVGALAQLVTQTQDDGADANLSDEYKTSGEEEEEEKFFPPRAGQITTYQKLEWVP